ncbi:hypothetical protein [Ralstonia solanacearum]|uniref:hypothetical protein n=1 Tax=Ralstonia solanacearum TaxID=305 RepID=UPI0005003271|nr:hypothetical protein [Ralstonia solanacearum]KFX26426.1 hypothetical protein KR96_23900 [Ralstonia solanacearum]
MNKLSARSLTGVWIVAGTLGLTKFWYAMPEHFPPALSTLGIEVIAWVNRHLSLDGEQGADVEIAYVLFVAFASVSIITWVGRAILRHKQSHEPS